MAIAGRGGLHAPRQHFLYHEDPLRSQRHRSNDGLWTDAGECVTVRAYVTPEDVSVIKAGDVGEGGDMTALRDI